MAKTMQAYRYYGPKDLRLEEVPIPKIQPDGMLIKIGAATTCGTDVKMYVRGYPELPQLPMPFGHECAGVVAEVGPDVKDYKVGERVVSGIAANCGKCYFCQHNQLVYCVDREYLIPGKKMAGGAYAEYIAVPGAIVRNNVHRIPDHLSFAEAAMVEPLACALFGIDDLPNLRIGDSVVIVGDGQLGLYFLRLAKLRGAFVILCGKHWLEKADELGADHVIDANKTPNLKEEVYKIVGSTGPDFVIENTGKSEVWELCVDMARRGGTVMLFGGCKGGTTVTFDTYKIHYDCLTIKSPSVYLQPADLLKRSLYLLASGDVPGRKFISGTYPLKDAVTALENHMNRKGIKFEIIPPSFWKE